jgi:hypothetical protein
MILRKNQHTGLKMYLFAATQRKMVLFEYVFHKFIIPRSGKGSMNGLRLSTVCVCMHVCGFSVQSITSQPLEAISWNFGQMFTPSRRFAELMFQPDQLKVKVTIGARPVAIRLRSRSYSEFHNCNACSIGGYVWVVVFLCIANLPFVFGTFDFWFYSFHLTLNFKYVYLQWQLWNFTVNSNKFLL